MKKTKWFGLVVSMVIPLVAAHAQPQAPSVANGAGQTQAAGAVPSDMSPAVSEAIRLAESGVGDDVVLAYIQNSQTTFNLTADHVLYLKDIGLSPAVTAAMLNHDTALRGQGQPYPPATQPPPPEPQPETPPQAAVTAPLTPPEYVSTPPPEVNYFYTDLSPYGAWVDLAGIGWCWQPRAVVINRGWRPYCDGGHWIYSDCGWYWQSDYSWGWAPFHYGRWQLHDRCGWVWQPDRVWGPAWVTWRAAGDTCGWAPLPPHAVFDARLGWRFNGISVGVNFDFGLHPDHFTFVALHNFNDRDLGHRRMPVTEVRNIYNRTTIINNYSVHNATVINRGIPVDRVASATHTQIRTVSVREAPKDLRTSGRVPSFDHSGTIVYRREPVATPRPTAVVAQKVDERHPVIQHAPITASQTQRHISGGAGGTAPVVTPGRAPSTTYPRPSQQPAVDRSYPQTQPAPHSDQPQPPATRSQPPESAPRSYTPQPSKPSPQSEAPVAPSRSITRSSDQTGQSTHSSASTRPDAAYSAASRSSNRDESRTSQTDSRAQNSHVYYPKTYRQSSELRSSSQPSQRSSVPSSSSHDSGKDSQPR